MRSDDWYRSKGLNPPWSPDRCEICWAKGVELVEHQGYRICVPCGYRETAASRQGMWSPDYYLAVD